MKVVSLGRFLGSRNPFMPLDSILDDCFLRNPRWPPGSVTFSIWAISHKLHVIEQWNKYLWVCFWGQGIHLYHSIQSWIIAIYEIQDDGKDGCSLGLLIAILGHISQRIWHIAMKLVSLGRFLGSRNPAIPLDSILDDCFYRNPRWLPRSVPGISAISFFRPYLTIYMT